MKVGDKVRCINDGGKRAISVGGTYIIADTYEAHGDKFIRVAERGEGYWEDRFELIKEGGKDVKEFEGYTIPTLKYPLNPNGGSCAYEGTTRTSDLGCVNNNCSKCIAGTVARDVLRKYLRTKGNNIPLNECFKTTKENKDMSININSTVAKVFKDVDEAALVTKWVGSEYEENNHRAFMDLNKNNKTVLVYVIDLEKEAEAKK